MKLYFNVSSSKGQITIVNITDTYCLASTVERVCKHRVESENTSNVNMRRQPVWFSFIDYK